MAFQLSPGVQVQERDLTTIVPSVATSAGGFAGAFQWGPVDEVTTVDSENNLVTYFGAPNDDTFESFFTAANFLSYGNNLKLVRVVNEDLARNATAATSNVVLRSSVTNAGSDYLSNVVANTTVTISTSGTAQPTTNATAIPTFVNGSLTGITITNRGSGYTADVIANTTIAVVTTGTAQPNVTATANLAFTGSGPVLIKNYTDYEGNWAAGGHYAGEFAAKYPGVLGNSLKVVMTDGATWSTGWGGGTYANQFNGAPGTSAYAAGLGGSNDEMHVLVIDATGAWTGTANTVLEKFAYVSKAKDALNSDGSTNYYKEVINRTSNYVYVLDHNVAGTNWGSSAKNVSFANLRSALSVQLEGGVSADASTSLSSAAVVAGFDLLRNDELIDVSLLVAGPWSNTTIVDNITNIAESRKDCVAFISPPQTSVVNITNTSTQTTNVINYRNSLTSSNYAVIDSGWKYLYDRYNDKYRWVPLNADIAGLCARTDFVADPWFSPGGLNRGQIKGVVKLAFNPTKTNRDELYKNGVNPVVTFPGQGTVLFGDKTMQVKPSAFDRINVRRLFIVLEKSIATAAKFQLFEFNDAFTRAQFRNIVEPFLRDVQGRRGITDFRVVCDETNNTGDVIDRNEFRADIYIKPARSINFISLTFIASRTGISFEEIGA